MVDLTPIVQFAETAALAIVTGGFALLARWGKQHLDFIKDAKTREMVATAIDAVDVLADQAAGSAYRFVQAHDADFRNPVIQSAVMTHMIEFMASMGGAAIKDSGVTPEEIARKVDAAFGRLLAVDPTVSIMSPQHTLLQGGSMPLGSTVHDAEPVPLPATTLPTTPAVAAMELAVQHSS